MRSGWKSQARRILAPVVLVAAVLTPAWPVQSGRIAGARHHARGKSRPDDPRHDRVPAPECVQPRRPRHRGGRRAGQPAALLHGQHRRRRLANDGRRRDLDQHLGRLLRGRVHRRPRRRRIRSQHHLRRHRLRLPARQYLARHRHLQVERRRQDLAAHRPARGRHDRAHPGPPVKSQSRLRRRRRQPLQADQGARHLPVARRRQDLGSRLRRERPHRRRRRDDGSQEPRRADCRTVDGRAEAVDDRVGQRRRRHREDHRRRQHLAAAAYRPAGRPHRQGRRVDLRRELAARLRADRSRQRPGWHLSIG